MTVINIENLIGSCVGTKNDDYKKGMRLLMQNAYEKGIRIRTCPWLPKLLFLLSKMDACEKFAINIINVDKLGKLLKCENIWELWHDRWTYTFSWRDTKEGFDFWDSIEARIIESQKNPDVVLDDSHTYKYLLLKDLIFNE